MIFRARSEFVPMTTRSGLRKSSMRGAFLEELGVRDDVESAASVTLAIASRTRSAVPTGTVLLSTMTV